MSNIASAQSSALIEMAYDQVIAFLLNKSTSAIIIFFSD